MCIDVSDFINFCENDTKASDILYYYCKHLLYGKDIFFDMLYDMYCKKYNIVREIEHYNMSKFIAFENFLDEAIKYNHDIIQTKDGLNVPYYTKNQTIDFKF